VHGLHARLPVVVKQWLHRHVNCALLLEHSLCAPETGLTPALQIRIEHQTADGAAECLRRAYAACGGAIPERCTMVGASICAGTNAAYADIRTIFGVEATLLFFVPGEKSKAHMKTHVKCCAYAPVLHAADAMTTTLTRTECSEDREGSMGIDGAGAGRATRSAQRHLFQPSRYQCAPARWRRCPCVLAQVSHRYWRAAPI
jgi:hypothetical protein